MVPHIGREMRAINYLREELQLLGDGDTGITPEELSKILKPTKQEDEETEAPGKKEPTKEELFQIALVDCLITRAWMSGGRGKELIAPQ